MPVQNSQENGQGDCPLASERVGLSQVALKFFKMSQVQKANILFVQQCSGQKYPPQTSVFLQS